VPETSIIFTDGFESGNLSAWSSSKTDNGDLSVSTAAALVDGYGFQANLDDSVPIYVTHLRPVGETAYSASFYFDPNSLVIAEGNNFLIFSGNSETTRLVVVHLRFSAGLYQINASVLDDRGWTLSSGWVVLSDAPHLLEFNWKAATAPASNDGIFVWKVDGIEQLHLTALDNDTRLIDRVQLGGVAGVDAGTQGALYFDQFVSWH
jgi:hypothetical protein